MPNTDETQPQFTPPNSDPDATLARPGDGLPGAVVIPGYDLQPEIARGGMGVVYAACDLAFGREVAIKVSHDKTAKVWDAKSGADVLTLRDHAGSVFAASFSADGNRIVTGSTDGTAKVWDAHTGAEVPKVTRAMCARSRSARTARASSLGATTGRQRCGMPHLLR